MTRTTNSTTAHLDERLSRLLSSDPEAMRDPYSLWRELRETSPIHRHGDVVLVSGYDQVREKAREIQRLSSRSGIEGALFAANRARLDEEQQQAQSEVASLESLYVSRSDGEQHERLRKVAHRAFLPRRIADMEASLLGYTQELLDDMPTDRPVDFRDLFAYRLPMLAITDMLGVPPDRRSVIHQWSNRLARNRGGDDPVAVMAAREATRQFREFVENTVVPLRRREPAGDLVSSLLEAEQDERMSPAEMTATFVVLLFAGHETTTNLLSIGLRELLRHPDQWQLLVERPDLATNAVEELLRWVSPVQWISRIATEDLQVAEVDVAQGETVTLVLAGANRDPDRFDNPERLDIERSDARDHLALGSGPHFCLGNALARLEGRIALEALARRFPDLAEAGEPAAWTGHAMLRTLTDLPIELGPDHG